MAGLTGLTARWNSAGVPMGARQSDPAPLQEAVRAGGMPYPPVDTHWSPAGHALVAECLALELRQRAWLTTAQPSQ